MKDKISLLYPNEEATYFRQLNEEVCNDLSIEYLCLCITNDIKEQKEIKTLLSSLTSDVEIIKFRSEIFEEFLEKPILRECVDNVLIDLKFLKEGRVANKHIDSSSIWELTSRLGELDAYIKCVISIKESLEKCDLKAEGLRRLYKYVNDIYVESGFSYLEEDIHELISQVSEIKSISLGINLDHNLKPKEVGIVSFNNEAFSVATFMQRYKKFANKNLELNDEAKFSEMTFYRHPKKNKKDPLMDNLTHVSENMLKATVNDLKKVLQKYVDISGYKLTKLIPEMTFYLRCADMVDSLRREGYPMVKATLAQNDELKFEAEGLYNIKLALHMMKTKESSSMMIDNTIDFKKNNRIYILTGPNRGGKTIFTQAIGLISLLFQNGIYVPCRSAVLSPVDNIFTHFPADENKTIEYGRLGEESERLNVIFSEATSESLLLFNETLTTTSHTEGLYIAKDLVKSFKYLGARTIFNTHMHDLADNIDLINSEVESDCKVASLVMGIENGERSYKVQIAPSQGMSYAKDIAVKYGVTYSQLVEKMRGRL